MTLAVLKFMAVVVPLQASSPTPIFGSSSTFGAASGFGGFKGVAAEPSKLSSTTGAAGLLESELG